jgi:hypothetical protein
MVLFKTNDFETVADKFKIKNRELLLIPERGDDKLTVLFKIYDLTEKFITVVPGGYVLCIVREFPNCIISVSGRF